MAGSKKPKILSIALQVEAQNLARQPAGDRLDANIIPANQPETLERRIEILRPAGRTRNTPTPSKCLDRARTSSFCPRSGWTWT